MKLTRYTRIKDDIVFLFACTACMLMKYESMVLSTCAWLYNILIVLIFMYNICVGGGGAWILSIKCILYGAHAQKVKVPPEEYKEKSLPQNKLGKIKRAV